MTVTETPGRILARTVDEVPEGLRHDVAMTFERALQLLAGARQLATDFNALHASLYYLTGAGQTVHEAEPDRVFHRLCAEIGLDALNDLMWLVSESVVSTEDTCKAPPAWPPTATPLGRLAKQRKPLGQAAGLAAGTARDQGPSAQAARQEVA